MEVDFPQLQCHCLSRRHPDESVGVVAAFSVQHHDERERVAQPVTRWPGNRVAHSASPAPRVEPIGDRRARASRTSVEGSPQNTHRRAGPAPAVRAGRRGRRARCRRPRQRWRRRDRRLRRPRSSAGSIVDHRPLRAAGDCPVHSPRRVGTRGPAPPSTSSEALSSRHRTRTAANQLQCSSSSGERGHHHADAADIDDADMEEIPRSRPAVDDPKTRPNQKHDHGHAAELGEACFETQQRGRELDLPYQPDSPDAKANQGDRADHHPRKLGGRE